MLNKFIFLLLLLALQLNADKFIDNTYYIDSDEIYISTIIKNVKNDRLIYKIASNRHTKRVNSKELLKLLKEHGYKDFTTKSRYVKFVKRSPVDTSIIAHYVREYYAKAYLNIEIKSVTVEPRSYITSLPSKYSINIKEKNYLSRSGVVSIKTPQNRQIFFNYDIVANVWIYLTRKQINKDVELSAINSVKKSIILDKFMAKPIQKMDAKTIQTKHRIKKDKIITIRNVELLSLVKRNSYINVDLHSQNMSIGFSAKALQNAKLNDIITVEKSNGKRLKVRVIGKNRAEIR